MALGLVVSPGSMPSPEDLDALRPAFLRSIVYSYRDVERLVEIGYPILLTVNAEMREVNNWAGWERAIAGIAKRSKGRVIGVCCGNENDLFWKDNPADVPPEFGAYLVRSAAHILRPAGIATIASSVAGPRWQEYLGQMADLCRDEADYFDFHPYGQRPDGFARPGWGFGDLRPALIRAYELAGKPVICSEIGVKIGDAGGEQQAADFLRAADSTIAQLGTDVCPYAAWFAWHDGVGAPSERGDQAFGLMSEHGYRRPAWDAFASLGQHVKTAGPDLSPWRGKVGEGLLKMLEQDGTAPVAPSWWHVNDIDEGVHAENGDTYIWVGPQGRGYRVPGQAA